MRSHVARFNRAISAKISSSLLTQRYTRYSYSTVKSMQYAQQIAEYNDIGYTKIPNVLNNDEIKCVQEHVEYLLKTYPDTHPELLEHWFVRDDPFWLSLVSHEKLLNIVEAFLGTSDIALFASHYVCKLGLEGKPIHWHQDGSYWPLEPMEVITLWLAVDDSNISNGCLQIVPYSHKKDLTVTNLSAHDFKDNVMESDDKIELTKDEEASITNVELTAGSVSIHHPMSVHGSDANISRKRRAGLTLRYIPTTTQVIEDTEDIDGIKSGSVYMLRGKKHAENKYRTVPEFNPNRHFIPSKPCQFVEKYCKY
eukprot:354210_1